jgi:predicted regulator of Ras-like GTPase activity (Roadblock/LC7/MglB family)
MSQSAASWSFEEADGRRINQLLRSFLDESHARCALLVDRTGQLIAVVGERPDFDSTAFASLAAADFAANDQLAAMIGDDEFSTLFHQGDKDSMYLVDVAGRVILIVLFDERATLGMIRIRLRSVVHELADVFARIFQRVMGEGAGNRLESAWVDEAEEEIDRLFGSQETP